MLVRLYETLFITRPEADADAVDKLHQRLLKSMEQLGGVEIKLVDWGKRKLAYEIAKTKKGNYWYFGFIAAPQYIKELERQLEIAGDVIRYQTVRLSELAPLESFNLDDERKRVESLTPEREEDEEEQYLRRQADDYRSEMGMGSRRRREDDLEDMEEELA